MSMQAGQPALAGWLLVGTGFLDLILVVRFARMKLNPHPRSRRILVVTLYCGAVLLMALGAALLEGWIG